MLSLVLSVVLLPYCTINDVVNGTVISNVTGIAICTVNDIFASLVQTLILQ